MNTLLKSTLTLTAFLLSMLLVIGQEEDPIDEEPSPTNPVAITNSAPTSLILAWDPPTTAVTRTNTTYRLYAHLGEPLSYDSRSNATATIDVAAQIHQAEFAALLPGKWHFVVTALDGGLESRFSNQVIHEQPGEPSNPENLRSVAIEYSPSLPGGWQNVGFFRIRIQ
jgi:hypothetical protein